MLRPLRRRLRLLLDCGRLRVLEAPPPDQGKAQEVLAAIDDDDRDAADDGDAGGHLGNGAELNNGVVP